MALVSTSASPGFARGVGEDALRMDRAGDGEPVLEFSSVMVWPRRRARRRRARVLAAAQHIRRTESAQLPNGKSRRCSSR